MEVRELACVWYTVVLLPASLSLQVFNVHLSEGVSLVRFKYHVFDVSLDATRLISSCPVWLKLNLTSIKSVTIMALLSNESPIEIGHIAV